MKIHPMGAEFFHADRRTYRHDELRIIFRNFANAPVNETESRVNNSIQFIFRSSDPEGGCNPQDIEHVNYI